jgi:4-hydroxythreonine-4-phosphate dehydrogenase
LPLKEVVPRLSTELIETKICLFAKSLKEDFNIKSPRIAVCGVNPHAGDNGLFGDEDRRLILPVVKKLQAKWQGQVTLQGPMPADTVFHFAFQGQYDGVLAMYHDQGLGPLKIVHFDTAVNLSGGLPHLRVSPDHGPAADLYLSQKASPKSWQSCYAVACQYLNGDMQQRSAT